MYEYIDENMEKVKKQTQAAFNNLRLSLLKFDELNVMSVKKESDNLFKKLKRQSDKFYSRLIEYLSKRGGFEANKYDVNELFATYSETLLYVFSPEMERKQSRYFETILCIGDMSDPEILVQQKKNVRNWNTQIEEFAVDMERTIILRELKESGTKKV